MFFKNKERTFGGEFKMASPKMVAGVLVALCLFGAGMVSATEGTIYETYDSEYFSVEYPPDWNVKRSLAAEKEGWDYTFTNTDSTDYIALTIGADEIELFVWASLNNIQNGSFDAQIQHFLDTLSFKNNDTTVEDVSQNTTYELYDDIYFSVESPQSWYTDKITLDSGEGTVYRFGDSNWSTRIGVTFQTFGSHGDVTSTTVQVPRDSVDNGKFEEPVQHFLDTLTFKM